MDHVHSSHCFTVKIRKTWTLSLIVTMFHLCNHQSDVTSNCKKSKQALFSGILTQSRNRLLFICSICCYPVFLPKPLSLWKNRKIRGILSLDQNWNCARAKCLSEPYWNTLSNGKYNSPLRTHFMYVMWINTARSLTGTKSSCTGLSYLTTLCATVYWQPLED